MYAQKKTDQGVFIPDFPDALPASYVARRKLMFATQLKHIR